MLVAHKPRTYARLQRSMAAQEPFVTYLELRASDAHGELGAGLSHTSSGLVLLHVLELAATGEPRGAVTVVHEAGEHGGRYLDLARALARRGWAVALPDLRGHGRSEGERGGSAGSKEIVRDLGDVQDHLAYRQPEAPKVLIGAGLGAIWAAHYARERPGGIAALVLVAPLLAPRFQLPLQPSGFSKLFKKIGPNAPGRIGFKSSDLASDAAELAARSADPLVHDVITLRAGEQAVETARLVQEHLSKSAVPVLVLAGARDPLVDIAAVQKLAGATVEVAIQDGLLHDLLHEARSGEVIERVLDWLDRKLPR